MNYQELHGKQEKCSRSQENEDSEEAHEEVKWAQRDQKRSFPANREYPPQGMNYRNNDKSASLPYKSDSQNQWSRARNNQMPVHGSAMNNPQAFASNVRLPAPTQPQVPVSYGGFQTSTPVQPPGNRFIAPRQQNQQMVPPTYYATGQSGQLVTPVQSSGAGAAPGQVPGANKELICYSCGGPGHYAKHCEAIQKHLQMRTGGDAQIIQAPTPHPNMQVGNAVDIQDYSTEVQATDGAPSNCISTVSDDQVAAEQTSSDPGNF